MKDPGIPSGSKCRGACGPNCPGTCTDADDVQLLLRDPEEPGSYFLLTYSGVKRCGTHEGCRWHDWCFDRCEEVYGESDSITGPCHAICNASAEYYGTVATTEDRGPTSTISAYNWYKGEGPFDRYWLFAEDVDVTRFTGDSTEVSIQGLQTYPDDFSDGPYGVSTYEIIFYTGHPKWAGTDAKINLELVGQKDGEATHSGPFHFGGAGLTGDAFGFLTDPDFGVFGDLRSILVVDTFIDAGSQISDLFLNQLFFERHTKNSFFRTGQEIGDLQEIVVGHDNSGALAPWYLDRITVID
ncbi:hypothetical protein KGY64_04520, partial [Candidatus Bipolaricaulota bacterium]|nr:hypothetical protein [Candidatus Bipolaricaulota bacterium]